MSKQANKTMIGAFVIGALALVIAGVLTFGSGKFLKKRLPCVMYFEGSVKGLNAGATVDFRGVKVGTVKDIKIRTVPGKATFEIPVFVELEPDRIETVEDRHPKMDPEEALQILIDNGLRARLGLQSVVTGQFMVELDFYPDTPPRLVGTGIDEYPEIPTIPTSLDELVKRIEKVPIEEILEKLHSAVDGIEKVVNSPEVMEAVRALDDTLGATKKLVQKVDNHVDPLLTDTEEIVRDARRLVRNVDGSVGRLVSRAEGAIESADGAIVQAQDVLRTLEDSAGDDSALLFEIHKTLKEVSGAARSIRLLADYLSQHPESLLRGKGGTR